MNVTPNANAPTPDWWDDRDYMQAIRTRVEFSSDSSYQLAFGIAELLPAELTAPDTVSIAPKTVGSRTWIVRRDIVPAAHALAWYVNAAQGTTQLASVSASGEALAQSTTFLTEPDWPNLILAAEPLPYLARWQGCARVHHLIDPDGRENALQLSLVEIEYLKENVFVDFSDSAYSELFGSINLVAPNPLVREVAPRLHTLGNGKEEVHIRTIPRLGKDISALTLFHVQRRPTGWTYLEQWSPPPPEAIAKCCTHVEESMYVLVCPKRGMLDAQPPTYFLSQISIGTSLITAQRRVTVPPSRRQPEHEYTATHQSIDSQTIVGKASIPGVTRILAAGKRRRRDNNSLTVDQYVINSVTEAPGIVRRLLCQAKTMVRIYDPYFSARDLFTFVASVNVPVEILVSQSTLNRESEIKTTTKTNGELLNANIVQPGFQNVSIRYFSSLPKPIHDRYLVVDNTIWLSGHSLNALGTAVSTIVRLSRPKEILSILEQVWNASIPLSQWSAPKNSAGRAGGGT